MPVNVNELLKQCEKSFNSVERTNRIGEWEELAKYLMPTQNRAFQGENTPGALKTTDVFVSLPIRAPRELAKTIQSTLMNSAIRWCNFKFKDKELNKNKFAVEWLTDCVYRLHEAYNSTNFDSEMAKSIIMFVVFGNMAILQEDKDYSDNLPFGGLRFKTIHLSEISWCENIDGAVDRVYRKIKLTARQAAQRFPEDKLSQKIKMALDQNPDEEFSFVHCVYARDPQDIKYNSIGLAEGINRPVASVYIDPEQKMVMEEDGYYEFPVHIARDEVQPGEVYGRGVGSIALPDIKSFNRLRELYYQSLAKAVNPPIMATERNITSTVDLRPARMFYVKDMDGIRPWVSGVDFNMVQYEFEYSVQEINKHFYLDKLTLPPRTETGEMSAFEVSQRIQEMQYVLGPVISKIKYEMLTQFVRRSFNSLLRGGWFLPVPEELKNYSLQSLEIEFVDRLARSQRMEVVNNMQLWVQAVAGMAQVMPSVLDVINGDFITTESAEIMGVPSQAINPPRQVAEIRQSREEAMQAQMQLEAGVKAADIAAKSSKAGGNNVQ